MPAAVTEKHVVALEMLERAVELFLRGDSYYAAIHLGGGAEELLSVYAREIKTSSTTTLVPAFDQMKDAFLRQMKPSSSDEAKTLEKWIHDRMSDAKNSVKHMRGRNDTTVGFDAKEEAYDVIDRAITTYFRLFSILNLRPLPSIEQFDAERRKESRSEA
jgi:hypothetical protein